MRLDAYRGSAEQFLSELTGEYRRHYAGLSPEYAIEPIYARHAELFTPEAVAALRAQLTSIGVSVGDPRGSGGDERRRVRMLLEFAAEGHIGEAVKEIDAALAQAEATLTISVGGDTVGYRESALVQCNEESAARRYEVEQARLEVTELVLNPLHRKALSRRHASTRALGFDSYAQLCSSVQEVSLDGLAAQTAAFLRATDARYVELLAPEVRATVGLDLEQMRRSDLPRFFRAAEFDGSFPAARLVASLAETLAAGGIELDRQPGVAVDAESRPGKSPRAFCAPVKVPGEVHLVIAPAGGRDDYEALLHEAGHTEHYAHVAAQLPFEFRMLGDNAVTECYAFLLQHLTDDPGWLVRRLGMSDATAGRIAAHARAKRLVYLRRYAAKLAYELELHSGSAAPESAAERYATLLGDSVCLAWPWETYLADVDPGFYCACYLRAWALETHLRSWLRQRFGPLWFEQRPAWDSLRELWQEGQRATPEELLAELTGRRELDFTVMAGSLD